MKTNINITISNSEEAKNFLTELYNNNEAYHPEDSAQNIIDYKTGENIFTNIEAFHLDELMNSVYEHADFDPCELLMDLGYGN